VVLPQKGDTPLNRGARLGDMADADFVSPGGEATHFESLGRSASIPLGWG
jgi:hypothetical protein